MQAVLGLGLVRSVGLATRNKNDARWEGVLLARLGDVKKSTTLIDSMVGRAAAASSKFNHYRVSADMSLLPQTSIHLDFLSARYSSRLGI